MVIQKKFIAGRKIVITIFGLTAIVIFLIELGKGPYDEPQKSKQWGVTFSIPYAKQLGLNSREAYLAILDELKLKELRIPVYWPIVEPQKNNFDFSAIDWELNEAKKRGVTVMLALGRRLPRWPECHTPEWVKSLPEEKQREEIFDMLKVVVSHYRNEKTIWAWQVENEPFLRFFGECPPPDEKFLSEEIQLVRRLDGTRPVVTSDSGELSLWFPVARYGDIFGTTIYRVVPTLDQKSFTTLNIPPEFYNKKANILNRFFPKNIFVIELQAEPWAQSKPIQDLTIDEQYASMSPEFFSDTINYVKRTGFRRVYLWGAEWWYWLKTKNHPEIWDEAKTLLSQ